MRIDEDAGTAKTASDDARARVSLRPARDGDIEAVLAIEHALIGALRS